MLKNLQNKIYFLLYDLNTENEFKTLVEIKISYNLNDKSYFRWRQIVNSIPKTWIKVLR